MVDYPVETTGKHSIPKLSKQFTSQLKKKTCYERRLYRAVKKVGLIPEKCLAEQGQKKSNDCNDLPEHTNVQEGWMYMGKIGDIPHYGGSAG